MIAGFYLEMGGIKMFDNNGHTMILQEKNRLQIYIWVQGAKLKLQTSNDGWDINELDEVKQVEVNIAESLKIPSWGFR